MTKTQLSRLTANKNTSSGTFYILPKLHKKTLESRPIVSNVRHPTKNISKFLHQTMIKTAESAHSFIKNSFELTKLLDQIPSTSTTFIITADIKSLYTLIPNEDGVKCVVNELTNKTKFSPLTLSTLLNLVLKNNIFNFGEENYIQINGTAMGTIMAPTYANIYLKNKEEKFLLNPSSNPFLNNIKLFKRYIDDICIVYENLNNNIADFLRILKKTYEPLELTVKLGKQNQIFLDTEISINTHKITTQLHQKPLSNKTYIAPSSQHPPHMLNNIIFNDLLRANRLCSLPTQRNKHEINIMAKAIKAGYKKKQLISLRSKARKHDKTTEPSSSQPLDNSSEYNNTIVSLTYNGKSTEKLAKVLKDTWRTNASINQRLMVAYKTHSNIKKLTVHSKLNNKHNQTQLRSTQ